MTPERYKIFLIYLREIRTILQQIYTGEYTKDVEINRWVSSIEYSLDQIKEQANEKTDSES